MNGCRQNESKQQIKNITIIHTTPVQQLTSCELKSSLFVRNKSIKTLITSNFSPFFYSKKAILWIEDSYFGQKREFELLNDLFLTNTQLFGLSFGWHPFTLFRQCNDRKWSGRERELVAQRHFLLPTRQGAGLGELLWKQFFFNFFLQFLRHITKNQISHHFRNWFGSGKRNDKRTVEVVPCLCKQPKIHPVRLQKSQIF